MDQGSDWHKKIVTPAPGLKKYSNTRFIWDQVYNYDFQPSCNMNLKPKARSKDRGTSKKDLVKTFLYMQSVKRPIGR